MQSREYTVEEEPRAKESLRKVRITATRKPGTSAPAAARTTEAANSRAEFQRCMDAFRLALDELEH
ncbi:MAG TPA: hypothetical protein VJQ52_18130 [Steroidobacteraceae bacterium]|nr:hypothetical protein [Steroidobacteraceae bacterium]